MKDNTWTARSIEWQIKKKNQLENQNAVGVVVVGWLLNVPATCECISGTDLRRQFYVLPH